jgi:hypothetical protein
MKYPQLVSSRAVREISDWLIRRLEDLDVEQPGVYSRLLLSLLHTPFKVNAIDILEIPQLKVKFDKEKNCMKNCHRHSQALKKHTRKETKCAVKKSSCDARHNDSKAYLLGFL